MPDDFEPDVATGGDDGGEPPVDDPTAAPEGEPAEPGGDVPADEPSPDGDGQPEDEPTPGAGTSEKLQKLLAKYGGDPDKMVDAYWEQAKSLSTLDRKLDKLIEKVNSKNLPPEEEAKLIAEDPDVKEIGSELASLDADVKAYDREDKQLVAQYGKLESDIKALEAKLEFAPDEVVQDRLRREIADAKREQREVGRDWRSNQTNLKNAQRDINARVRQFREAEIRAKAKRDQAKKQEWDNQTASESTRREFAIAMRAEAESYGLALDSKTYGVLQQSVRDRLVTYLRSLGDDAEGIDIPGAVGVLMLEYADAMNLKKKFGTVSKQKAGVVSTQPAGVVKPKGEGKPTTDKNGNWTPQYVRERAKRLLG